MKRQWIIICLFAIVSSAFSLLDKYPFVLPAGWPKPVFDFKNHPLQAQQVYLGRVLFYDPILSKDNSIACAGCHSPHSAFAHTDHALSHGIHDSIGKRNAPALMNLAWMPQYMWDGSVKNLDEQSLIPITHPAEMGEDLDHVMEKLDGSKMYQQLFSDAFGDAHVTRKRMMSAITSFMLTLVSSNAKYDSVIRKQAAFTDQEGRGYALFRNHCASCHTEPLFTNHALRNNGLAVNEKLQDFGRMSVTHQRNDSLLFKVPGLRNIQYSYPYMHDGRFKKLSEVIDHYASGIAGKANLSAELSTPISLSSYEKVDLLAFLLTLSDRSFLFDHRHQFPDILKNQSP